MTSDFDPDLWPWPQSKTVMSEHVQTVFDLCQGQGGPLCKKIKVLGPTVQAWECPWTDGWTDATKSIIDNDMFNPSLYSTHAIKGSLSLWKIHFKNLLGGQMSSAKKIHPIFEKWLLWSEEKFFLGSVDQHNFVTVKCPSFVPFFEVKDIHYMLISTAKQEFSEFTRAGVMFWSKYT